MSILYKLRALEALADVQSEVLTPDPDDTSCTRDALHNLHNIVEMIDYLRRVGDNSDPRRRQASCLHIAADLITSVARERAQTGAIQEE